MGKPYCLVDRRACPTILDFTTPASYGLGQVLQVRAEPLHGRFARFDPTTVGNARHRLSSSTSSTRDLSWVRRPGRLDPQTFRSPDVDRQGRLARQLEPCTTMTTPTGYRRPPWPDRRWARARRLRMAWGGLSARRSASKLTGHLPGSVENGQSGTRHSLISSLIHLRTPASIGVYDWPLSSQRDFRGRSCTVIRNTEKRKLRTPPHKSGMEPYTGEYSNVIDCERPLRGTSSSC
jgi:hypothetical protein